jgi:hypothetical protein
MLARFKNIKNSVWNGIAIGIFIPLIPGVLAWLLIHKITALKDADLLLIGCVALNALLMNYFFKANKDNVARGIISITFLWAFAFFAYKVF